MPKLQKMVSLWIGVASIAACKSSGSQPEAAQNSLASAGSFNQVRADFSVSRKIAAQRSRDLLVAQYYANLENRNFGIWYKSTILEILMDYASHPDWRTEDPKPAKFLSDSFQTIDPQVDAYSQLDHSRFYRNQQGLMPNFYPRYGNDFMDETLLWGLIWARATEFVEGSQKSIYLKTAKDLFAYAEKIGPSDACKKYEWRPMRWGPTLDQSSNDFLKKNAYYVNAITNEFYIALAMRLFHVTQESRYLWQARNAWNWFRDSGLITGEKLIIDGLTAECRNNGNSAVYSYNHGVILAGLTDLYRATNSGEYLDWAYDIAFAYVKRFNVNDVVTESVGPSPDGNKDGHLFKGYFIRYLGYLVSKTPENNARWRDKRRQALKHLRASAEAVWKHRNLQNSFGYSWERPHSEGGIEPTLLASGLDALLAVPDLNASEALPQVCFYDRVFWERQQPAKQYCYQGEKLWESAVPNDSYAAIRIFPGTTLRVFENGVSAQDARGFEKCWEGGDKGIFVSWLGTEYAGKISSFAMYKDKPCPAKN